MLKIKIETIEHKKQRYETCGDYYEQKGWDVIKVSKLKKQDHEFLIAIHEALEQYLCKKRGIKEKDICDFDIKFEKERKIGKHRMEDEPGDDKKAPYRKEHFFATNIERQVAHELGVDWSAYEKECIDLIPKTSA